MTTSTLVDLQICTAKMLKRLHKVSLEGFNSCTSL